MNDAWHVQDVVFGGDQGYPVRGEVSVGVIGESVIRASVTIVGEQEAVRIRAVGPCHGEDVAVAVVPDVPLGVRVFQRVTDIFHGVREAVESVVHESVLPFRGCPSAP